MVVLIRRKKACRFLGIVAAPVVKLRGARVTVACGLLHVFELRTVLQRRGNGVAIATGQNAELGIFDEMPSAIKCGVN
jgi:hypothetical protein